MRAPSPEHARAAEPSSRGVFSSLEAGVRAMAAEPDASRDALIADALRQLARAIEVLSHGLSLSPGVLRSIADRAEGSGGRGISQADVSAGLETTLGYLLSRALPQSRELEYEHAANALAADLEAMNKPGAAQSWWAHARSAFRAAADLSFMAAGRAPPFQTTWQAPPTGRLDVCEAMLQARSVVLELGRTRWPDARTASARALEALAHVIEAESAGGRRAAEISSIEFQAERLQRSSSLALSAGSWVKTGLTVALETFEKLWSRDQLAPWITAARAAIDGIEAGRSLSFQRAAVQDAFRATMSVAQAAMQPEHSCAAQAAHSE